MAPSLSCLLLHVALCVVAAACSKSEDAGDGLAGVTLRVALSPTNNRDGKRSLRCEILLPRDIVAVPAGRRWFPVAYEVTVESLDGEFGEPLWCPDQSEGGRGPGVCLGPGGEAWLSFDSAVSVDSSRQQRVRYDQTFEREGTGAQRRMSTGWMRFR